MFSLLIAKIRKIQQHHQSKLTGGFTLLELLVSIIIAGLIVSGLLYVVIELIKNDRTEARLDQTQRDIQRAIDYMADDIKEAVFVYSDPTTPTVDLDSDFPNGTPVLAFWRTDPVTAFPPTCDRWATGGTDENEAKHDECEVLKIRQASYSLVVYVQRARTNTDTIWKGASRIVRYELDKYRDSVDLVQTAGYQDPTDPEVGFERWAPSAVNTAGNGAVLVDFVDSLPGPAPSGATGYPCSDIDLGFQSDPTQPDYSVVPAGLVTEQNSSFYACVRNAGTGGISESYSNQDAYIFLRGNAVDGAQGVVNALSDDSSLPTLKTRVLMRGVVNKNPN